ncbi:MAG TPA: hypothetical protein VN812_13645 [Candidatus Acidoferrales bacterium]|nr:hypothetical protein [Candidatus Acidoferrales bacterium]
MANSRVGARSERPRTALALLLAAATLAVSVAALPGLPQLSQTVSLVPADDPDVQLDREITAQFGMQNPVVWIIEARHGTVWTPAMLKRIQALTREVFTVPGVIADDVVGLASPNLRDLRVTEDALEPVYLMAQAPETAEAVDTLRHRVENDPNYRGTLVSEDGRAAMVVANFRDDVDATIVAGAALALRDRYRDADTAVYAVGAPVLGTLAARGVPPLAATAALVLAVGFIVLSVTAGIRLALAAALAAVLATWWTAAVEVALGAAVLPWTVYALLPTALMAAAVTTTTIGSWRTQLPLAVALAMGFVALAAVAGAPAAAFGVAGAVGSVAAVLAGRAARILTACETESRALPHRSWARRGAPLLAALALLGTPRLRTSFGMFGYGARYLPPQAVADVRALARHFPPPTALAIRFRGEPGFVESPEVLKAFDGLAQAVRNDPAVVRVLSLADLVKMVNRAFNENRDEFLVLPEERDLIARYLALAYSPGFRRFVDRAFTQSAMWVYLSSEQPGDLDRVRTALRAQLAAHPVPAATVDFIGGDGAVVLVTARLARALAVGAAALLLLGASGIAVLCGASAGVRALAGGLAATAVATGVLVCCAAPVDLVSLPCLIAAAVAGMAFGALTESPQLCLALAAMAVLLVAASVVSGTQLGAVFGALLAGPAVAGLTTTTRGATPHES